MINSKKIVPNNIRSIPCYNQKISANDLKKIKEKYGDNLEDIFELAPGQRWMLHPRANNKSAFFLQMTFIVEMDFDLSKFKKRVDEVCEKRETLRFAYVSTGLDNPYCVKLKNRTAEIIYRDLSDLSDEMSERITKLFSSADRRRGFNLENDPLLRITVIKLHNENQYAFIISQPHINSDGTSLGFLIKEIFIDYALGITDANIAEYKNAYREYADYLKRIDIKPELDYWKKYLCGATSKTQLPGMDGAVKSYHESVYLATFDEELEAAIKDAQKRFKVTTYNILQSAWGIMLSRITGSSDIIFGTICSGRDAAMLKSMFMPGGFVKVIPIRMQINDDMTFSEIAKEAQSSLTLSMKNSHCSTDQIMDAIGRKEPLFHHIIDCHNFAGNQSIGTENSKMTNFKIIAADAYDNLSEDMMVYFKQIDDRMGIAFGYNDNLFSKEVIELYAKTYQDVLKQILIDNDDPKVADIKGVNLETFEQTARIEHANSNRKTMILKNLPLFKNVEWDEMKPVSMKTEFKTYMSGDVVFNEDEKLETIPIVVSGKIELLCRTKEGWLNPLKICSEGDILSFAGFAEASQTEMKAIAILDGASVIFIHRKAVEHLNRKHLEIYKTLIYKMYIESMNYKKMLINL